MGGRKSDKKYTNEAWTKRVDYETGRHHSQHALEESAECKVCGDVNADRRWTKPAAEQQEVKHPRCRPPIMTNCPACKRQREKAPSGFVHLDGARRRGQSAPPDYGRGEG